MTTFPALEEVFPFKINRYCAPIILNDNNHRSHSLYQVPLGKPPFREDRLQQLLAEHPEVLPINEIDYSTELSTWSFDDLRSAISKSSNQLGTAPMTDILENIRTHEGDFDEVNYIDSVSKSLNKGKFMLAVVGNGIHEGVENIADYLQKNPSLYFSFALIELNLYRLQADQDFPLYIQPRTLAKTVELIRAVVDVKALPELEVSVEMPTEKEINTGKTRRKLTEEIFYDELAVNRAADLASQVKELIQELKDLGLLTLRRSSSVSIRLSDPGESGYQFTVIVFQVSGSAYLNWLDRFSDQDYGGYDEKFAVRFRNCVARIFGIPEENSFVIDENIPVGKLYAHKEDFIGCVHKLISEIISAARTKHIG